MKHYKTLIFDLDGTLSISKAPLSSEMAEIFSKASQICNLAVITGGMFNQIEKQVIGHLTSDAVLSNIFILPTSGSEMRLYNSESKEWEVVYSEKLSDEQTTRIIAALKNALEKSSFKIGEDEILGEQIEDRESQITFSALGQKQNPESKAAWDPDGVKRREMMGNLTDLEDEFDVKFGGSTSIDITLKGIDKEFGVNEFLKQTGFDIRDSLFVGDKIIPCGNDWAATKTGIDTRSTTGPDETMHIIVDNLKNHQ